MTNRQRLGELLIQQKLVSQDLIDQALRTQVGGNRRLGHILVRMKAITDDQLAETLANQLDISLCNIDDRFSPEVRKILPRYLCREYSVLPLALKSNNILEVAMANPADEEAKTDIERYTGKVVEPFLARHSDIDREVSKRIPIGLKDIFSPKLSKKFTRIGIAACLVMITLLGGFTYEYIHTATYGTVSVTADSTIWKNHDLMLGIDKHGTINLLGRGAYADGYYSVTFADPKALNSFIAGREKDLSDKQKDWLDWAITEAQAKYPVQSLSVTQ
jgi:hypothetical protein